MAVRPRASEKMLVIVSISVFVVLAGTFAGLSYKAHKTVLETREETKVINAAIRKLQSKIDKLPAMQAERDELAARMAENEKILPAAEEIENLMTMLSEQAALSDCKVSDFSLVAGAPTPGMRPGAAAAAAYKKVNFSCAVSSNKLRKGFYSACKFLNLLERYERFIAADDFTIRVGGDAEISMHLDLTAHTYTFTGKMAGGSAAGVR
ncbi:type 4a pilus biogenesis protein PilO [Planctomycetota bacterium]